jgi:prepilin-type N-terminal cleavage/methylation domain-containing protein
MARRQGFSIVEVMTGVAVIGILTVASVPNISSYLRSRSAVSASDQIGAHLRMARSRAILEGNDYLVQINEATSYSIVDDDGGGNGVPGAVGYDAANRGNGRADAGEIVLGPYTLPADLQFLIASGTTNPFTGETIVEPVTFPELEGFPTVVFHANGTAEDSGYIALAPAHDVQNDSRARCRVVQVLGSTGSVASRAAMGS